MKNFTLSMATLSDILSPVWTLSVEGGGAIAEGIEAIKQCLTVILRTTPGTDPFRPTFGCGLHRFIDQPLNVAIPNIKKAMLDSIARWETRVKVTKITHTLGDTGQVVFNVGYTLQGGTLSDSLTVSVGGGGVSTGTAKQRLILRALLPPSGSGLQYQVSGQIGGTDILPAPPAGGFATVDSLYTWVQNNWLNYGQWYLTADALVGYLNPQFSSASLGISLLSVRQIAAVVPAGIGYTVTVSVAGVSYSNPEPISTIGGILGYLVNDPLLGAVGDWQVVSVPGDFTDEFGTDFNTMGQELQLITTSADTITISIVVN